MKIVHPFAISFSFTLYYYRSFKLWFLSSISTVKKWPFDDDDDDVMKTRRKKYILKPKKLSRPNTFRLSNLRIIYFKQNIALGNNNINQRTNKSTNQPTNHKQTNIRRRNSLREKWRIQMLFFWTNIKGNSHQKCWNNITFNFIFVQIQERKRKKWISLKYDFHSA